MHIQQIINPIIAANVRWKNGGRCDTIKLFHKYGFLAAGCVAKTMDDTPYLIVDNVKLAPIRRINRIVPNLGRRPRTQEKTMGIVDRVTLSKEARQLAAQMAVDEEISPETNALVPVPRSSLRSQPSLLTYSRNLSK